MHSYAHHIQRAFNRAADSYDVHCQVQLAAGARLLSLLTGSPQHILDLGCGTGIVTEKLAQQFPCADIHAIDIASSLLNIAKQRLIPYRAYCHEGDFHYFDSTLKFDLIFSNMALHWSNDIITVIKNVKRYLSPHGMLAFSIPVSGTFRELQSHFSINSFVDLDFLTTQLNQSGFSIENCFQEKIIQHFPDTISALKSIKAVGANFTQQKSCKNSYGKTWLKNVEIRQLTYELGYIVLKEFNA